MASIRGQAQVQWVGIQSMAATFSNGAKSAHTLYRNNSRISKSEWTSYLYMLLMGLTRNRSLRRSLLNESSPREDVSKETRKVHLVEKHI